MQCTSLKSTDANDRKGPELTFYQRGLLIEACSEGATLTFLSKQFELPCMMILSTLKSMTTQRNEVSKPHTDRPTVVTDQAHRIIIQHVKINSKITYKQLCGLTDDKISKSTLYRVLKNSDIINWMAKKRSRLRLIDAELRLEWTKKHEDWIYNRWANVIWSDECSVKWGSDKRRQWVFRTPDQKWDKNMIQDVSKGKDVRVMIWAAFWGGERSDLYALKRDFEAKKKGYSVKSYIQVLKHNLHEIYHLNLIFMQDNAPFHTAKAVKNWFEEWGIEVMKWPPYSPDLNSIEHLWYKLKEMIYDARPDIEWLRGSDEKIQAALLTGLQEVWLKIDKELMKELIRSMNMRVNAVIQAEGWYTHF